MSKSNFSQKSFLAGEWSDFAQGRADTEEYAQALKECTNFLPLEEGCLTRRPGFFSESIARSGTNNIKLQRFIISNDDAYIFEFTALRMRVYKDGGILKEAAKTVVSFSNADPGVVVVTGHGYNDGDIVMFTPNDGTTAAAVRNRLFEIDDKTTNDFTLDKTLPFSGNFNGADLTGWDGGTVQKILEITTPWTNSDINDLKFDQNDDGLFVFHPSHETRRISRGATDLIWNVRVWNMTDGPYLDNPESGVTFTPSGTSGSITVTASGVTDINGGVGFLATDVGRWMRMQSDDDTWGRGKITARGSSTSVTVSLNSGWGMANTNATSQWRLGVFSDTDGWPSAGTFHEGRLMLVGPVPNRVDGSKSFKPNKFDPTFQDGTVADDNGVSYLLLADDNQDIYWIISKDDGLIVGTQGGEWIVRASVTDEPLTPTNIQARRVTEFGCADIAPAQGTKATVFVQAQQRRVIEFSRFDRSDTKSVTGYDGINLARFAKHLTTSGIAEIVYQRDPLPIMWVRRTDGELVAFNYKRAPDQSYVGWHQHEFDTSCVSTTVPDVWSMAVGVAADGLSQELWIAVSRLINGVTIITVERQAPINELSDTPREEEYFVGSGIQYSDSEYAALWDWTGETDLTLTFYGLWAIEGECIDIMFRGADLGEFTVTNGQVVITVDEGLAGKADDVTYGDEFSFIKAVDTEFTFNSDFLSDVEPTGMLLNPDSSLTLAASHSGNSQLITGADNKVYLLASAGANSREVHIVDVLTGVTADNISTDDMDAESRTQSLNPNIGHDYDFTSKVIYYWTVPGTKYFWVKVAASIITPTTAAAHFFMLCEITAASLINPVGGFMHRSSSGNVNQVTQIHGFGILGDDPLADSSMLINSRGGSGADQSYMLRLPSITSMLGSWTVNLTDDTILLVRQHNWSSEVSGGHGFLDVTLNTYHQLAFQKGFILPTDDGALMCVYIGNAITQKHRDDPGSGLDNDYILTQAQNDHPNGFVIALPITLDATAKGFSVGTLSIINDDFQNANGTAAIPWSDVGLDIDGTTGVPDDDYLGPSVTNTGDSRIRVLWPRVYSMTDTTIGEYSEGSFAKVVIFEWDQTEEKATLTKEIEGAWFDSVNDPTGGGIRFTSKPHAMIPTWTGAGNLVYLHGSFTGVSSSIGTRWMMAKFGVYDPGRLITLDTGVTTAIGLGYKSRIQLLRPDLDLSRTGVGLGKVRRIDRAGLLLYRTGPFKLGTNYDDNILLRLDDPLVSGVQPLFSGVYLTAVEGTSDQDNEMTFEMERPFPMTLLAVSGFAKASEK